MYAPDDGHTSSRWLSTATRHYLPLNLRPQIVLRVLEKAPHHADDNSRIKYFSPSPKRGIRARLILHVLVENSRQSSSSDFTRKLAVTIRTLFSIHPTSQRLLHAHGVENGTPTSLSTCSHRSIHDWESSPALFPRIEVLLIDFPLYICKLLQERPSH
jgi:hypothetical protein